MSQMMQRVSGQEFGGVWASLMQQFLVLGFEGFLGSSLILIAKWGTQKMTLAKVVSFRNLRLGIFPLWCARVLFAWVGMAGFVGAPLFAQSAEPVQAPSQGSTLTNGPLVLTLRQAVDLALESNTQVQLTREEMDAAKARSHEALGALLPNVSGAYSQANVTANLRAQGLDFSRVPLLSSFNPFIGPFNTFDARAYLQQTLFNFAVIRTYQAARAGNHLSTLEAERARRDTIAIIAALYYGVLQATAHIEATQSNLRLNQSLLDLAEHQKEAGTGTAVDVTRAKVQLAQQQQRLLSDQVAYEDAKLRLLRTIGKDVSVELSLVDSMTLRDVPAMSLSEALAQAGAHRVELESQEERQHIAQLQLRAAKAERLPSIGFMANYGSSGLTPDNSALPTRTYGVAATIPIFDGGRREARIAEQSVKVRQEAVRAEDVKQQVEIEVRLGLKTLDATRRLVHVAEENLSLAETELELARDRFQEGVTNNIEVVNAQTSLEQARDRKVDALYLFNLARVNLDRALGQVEKIYQ
jgi:outer membrane protein